MTKEQKQTYIDDSIAKWKAYSKPKAYKEGKLDIYVDTLDNHPRLQNYLGRCGMCAYSMERYDTRSKTGRFDYEKRCEYCPLAKKGEECLTGDNSLYEQYEVACDNRDIKKATQIARKMVKVLETIQIKDMK